jgi:hypothetical protein
MVYTLKERRQIRKIHEVNAKAHRELGLIIEAIDEAEGKQIRAVIDKLRKMGSYDIAPVRTAVNDAVKDLQDYKGGNILKKLGTTVLGRGGLSLKGPLVRAVALANMLETGFSQMEDIIATYVPEGTDLKNTVETLGALIAKEGGDPAIANASKEIQKAFSPSGFFGNLKDTPYLDREAFVKELMGTPLPRLINLGTLVLKGPKATDVDDALGDTGPNAGQPTEPNQKTGEGEPTKGTAGGQEARPGQERGQTDMASAADKVALIWRSSKRNKEKFIKTLMDAGLNPDKLPDML